MKVPITLNHAFFEQFTLNLAVAIMATSDRDDYSSLERPWPYLMSMFEIFEMKKVESIVLNFSI